MVHPATRRAVLTAITSLAAPLDVGFVFPPKPGEQRGIGRWTNRDLGPAEIMAMLPRASAANARGGNVFMRLGPSVKDGHPGIVMIDDLTADAVERLGTDGFEPLLVTESSRQNFQAWIKLVSNTTIAYSVMGMAARHLAQKYGGDERAVSPRQPGRLPGFTNRKPRHQQADGRFPFVLLALAEPGRVATNGGALLDKLTTLDTARAAARATPETPRAAAGAVSGATPEIMERLDAIHGEQRMRIQREVAAGCRPIHAASQSEVDFATTRAALQEGISHEHVVAWLALARSDKDASYPERTLTAVEIFGATRTW